MKRVVKNLDSVNLNNYLWYTDPYTSWSSKLGFSGTLGGAWNFGATVTAGTTETEKKQTMFSSCNIHNYIS